MTGSHIKTKVADAVISNGLYDLHCYENNFFANNSVMEVDVNPRTQTLFKLTPSQTLGENHQIFGQLKIHTCNQVLIKVQKYTKNIAPWLSFPLRSKY